MNIVLFVNATIVFSENLFLVLTCCLNFHMFVKNSVCLLSLSVMLHFLICDWICATIANILH